METTSSRISSETATAAEESKLAPTISRIDPPHPLTEGNVAPTADMQHEDVPTVPDLEAIASAALSSDEPAHVDFSEQLHTQALQLADHLRAKQRELDRREALLNSREAKLDNEMRMGRLWRRERDQDVVERERQFQQRHQELDAKNAELALVEATVDRDLQTQQAELALREQALIKRDEDFTKLRRRLEDERAALRTAETRLERQRAKLAAEQQLAEQRTVTLQVTAQATIEKQLRNLQQAEAALAKREAELNDQRVKLAGQRDREVWETRLATRQTALDESETLLSKHAAEIDAARVELAAERERQMLEMREQRRELANWQQQERASLAARKEQLDVANGVLDNHRTAVEQLRADTARMHREAIEMRLVSEQLWLELAHHAPPAELTQSVAMLRKRLAENYRGAKEHVAEQKAEIVRLASRLDDQQKQILSSREQLHGWLAVQQQELETQAARLVQRELELDAQQQQMVAEQTRWANERRDLQQELRHRLARIRNLESAAA